MRPLGFILVILLAAVESLSALAIIFAARGNVQIMLFFLGAQVVLTGVAFYFCMSLGASASDRRLEALLRFHDDPVAWISPAGIIHSSDDRAAAAGITAETHVQNVPGNWLKPLFDDALRRNQTAAPPPPASAPKDSLLEFHLRIGMGDARRFYLPCAVPVTNRDGNIAAIMLVLRDRTELKRAHQARTIALSGLSHDLKTPMTSIQMSIHLLLEDAASRLTPRQLDLLQAARDDSERLQRKVEELLAKTRPPEK